jgi:hypothetical protein
MLKRLFYNDEIQWRPVPSWSRFFIELGAAIAEESNNLNRVVIGLALPTRAYAACFAALGVITQRVVINNQKEEILKYYEKIVNLPIGTDLIYRNPSLNKAFKARYEGCTTMENQQCIQLTIQKKHKLSKIVRPQDVLRISIANNPVNLPTYQKGYSLEPSNDKFLDSFLDDWVGQISSRQFMTSSTLDCLIMGNKNLLRTEIEDASLAVPSDIHSQTFVSGCFQDILRVRSFNLENSGYHCDVLASYNDAKEQKQGEKPFVTIFDNALSYLRWRDYWKTSHSIVLLDHTDTHCNDAVAQLNEDFVNRRSGESWNNLITNIPTGIEMMSYREEL